MKPCLEDHEVVAIHEVDQAMLSSVILRDHAPANMCRSGSGLPMPANSSAHLGIDRCSNSRTRQMNFRSCSGGHDGQIVGREVRVCSDQGQPLGHGLSDQQTVKGVAVVGRELSHCEAMRRG